ncbi:patatin-like phospholipase family protein [Actinoplanes friuliensis]|uniref:patatin-like phospholipase family protein n=1 Tax=Actinoplanes friuliensis TaxID=196914 RepID=UPI0005A076AA|nr:patatin-like phospholipase family protein [Actinoplanes friuliensis]
MQRALVLGGGGSTGVAWETGLIAGLAELGVDLSTADMFVGTSAGAIVTAQLSTGVPIAELFAGQTSAVIAEELTGSLGVGGILRFMVTGAWWGDHQRGRAWLGRAALRASTPPEAERRPIIEQRLPVHDWPSRPLRLTAVDAESGEFVTFDAGSGVPLVDAVAASCAVPTVWAPVTINGRRYVDGGVRSLANVDAAAGCDRLVVLSPRIAALRRGDRPDAQAATLGVPHVVISADRTAQATMGANPMNPAYRVPAARAGFEQAARVVDQVRGVWAS